MNLKKTAFFAMALAFCSCVQEAENQFQEGTNSFLAESSEVLDTKVTLDNDGTPLWQAGDKVSVWGGVFDNAIYTADYSGDRTSLSTVVEGEIAADEVYYAMSPYVEGASFADQYATEKRRQNDHQFEDQLQECRSLSLDRFAPEGPQGRH